MRRLKNQHKRPNLPRKTRKEGGQRSSNKQLKWWQLLKRLRTRMRKRGKRRTTRDQTRRRRRLPLNSKTNYPMRFNKPMRLSMRSPLPESQWRNQWSTSHTLMMAPRKQLKRQFKRQHQQSQSKKKKLRLQKWWPRQHSLSKRSQRRKRVAAPRRRHRNRPNRL